MQKKSCMSGYTSWNKEVKTPRSENHAIKRRDVITQHNILFYVNDTEGVSRRAKDWLQATH